MESILSTFGIDWRLLIINAINFGILLLGLGYFLYTPVMNMLEKRRETIAKGVADAEAAGEMRKEISDSRSGLLSEAGKEADTIVANARAAGAKKEREIVSQGEAAAAVLTKDAEAAAAELKAKALEESKQEVAKLIVLGIEKAHSTSAGQAAK